MGNVTTVGIDLEACPVLRWATVAQRTGHYEPTSDAGYTTAGVTPTAINPDHVSYLREESIYA